MLNETPAQLVAHLSHPNGWWRDTAQQLLVLKQDKSVVPALEAGGDARRRNQLARIHALWTLEGLGALDAVARARADEGRRSADPHPGDSRERDALQGRRPIVRRRLPRRPQGRATPTSSSRRMLTSKLFNLPDLKAIVEAAQAANKARGVQVIGTQILNPAAANAGRGGGGGRGGPPPFTDRRKRRSSSEGDKVYKELCFTCHGEDGRGAPQDGGPAGTIMAPPLVGSPRVQGHRDYVIKTLLHGMTGPLDGQDLSGGRHDADGRQQRRVDREPSRPTCATASATAPRSSRAADVARVRAATAARKTLWTPEELEATVPRVMVAQPTGR